MYNKAVDKMYMHQILSSITIRFKKRVIKHFVPECCKTQEKYVKAVDTCAVVFNSVAD